MCLLVVNAHASMPDQHRASPVAARISEIVQRARFSEVPVAHLHQVQKGTFAALRIPIGRFDPVFKSENFDYDFPSGLIEFIVRSPSDTINLVGAASLTQFKRLSRLVKAAGYDARLETSAIMSLDV